MKTTVSGKARTLCATLLISAYALVAHADVNAPAKEKTCSGMITAVDAPDKVVKVQMYLFHKTFVLGDNCALALSDKSAASLADFRPGQKVKVSYIDAHGVLVADRVAQEELTFSGQVRKVDQNTHTLTVHHVGASRTFAVAQNCNVLLNGNAIGGLADVKRGERETVIYEVPDGQYMAREIEQKSTMLVGTLAAVNLPDQTISLDEARHGSKLFRLSDDCAIIINDKSEGRLDDLQPGQKYELSYDSVKGVNVVNRIALAQPQGKAEISQRR
jgi:hypothetical protein